MENKLSRKHHHPGNGSVRMGSLRGVPFPSKTQKLSNVHCSGLRTSGEKCSTFEVFKRKLEETKETDCSLDHFRREFLESLQGSFRRETKMSLKSLSKRCSQTKGVRETGV